VDRILSLKITVYLFTT